MITKSQAVALLLVVGICTASFGNVPDKSQVPAPAEREVIEAVVLQDRGGYAYITFQIRVKKANPKTVGIKEDSEMEVVIRSYRDPPPLGKLCVMELKPSKTPNGTDWFIEKWSLKTQK